MGLVRRLPRALALRGGSETRVLSRNQKDLGKKFTKIRDSIAALDVQDTIKFAGRVGTGFSEKLLKALSVELNKIAIKACPFFQPLQLVEVWIQG